MARRGRPSSESYQSVCYSGSSTVSLSAGSDIVGMDDEEDQAPIFSLSKSSMDVVMVSGLPHKRDPAWARTDLRRSSSTNTHSEQNAVTLQQLHPQMWQHLNANSHQLSLTGQNADMHGPPVLSERWITNMQRWSGCSASTHSRSSTPDTIVWKDGNSRPSSLTQIPSCSGVPDSPELKPTSAPTTPSSSPSVTPVQTPTLTSSSSLLLTPQAHQQKDIAVILHSPSPPLPPPPELQSPIQASTSSHMLPNSPDIASTNSQDLEENNTPDFMFPPSACEAEDRLSDAGSIVDGVIEVLQSPGAAQLSESGEERSPGRMLSPSKLHSCHSSGPPSPGGMQSSESEVRSPVYLKPDYCNSSDPESPRSRHLSESGEECCPGKTLRPLKPGFCLSPELCSPGGMQSSESGEVRSPVYLKPEYCLSSDPESPRSRHLSESGEDCCPRKILSPLKPGFCLSPELCSPGGMQSSESGEVRSPAQMFGYHKPDFCPSSDPQSPGSIQLSECGEVRSPAQIFGYHKSDFCPSSDPQSPGSIQLSECGEVRSPRQMFSYPKEMSGQETGPSVCHLKLPWQPDPNFPTGLIRRSPLVLSLSDSQLGECCKCKHIRAEAFQAESTKNTKLQLVDAAVQTITPMSSFWGLRRNTSNSNMGSHSLLGSPPGSRLNLKSSIGSNSNLVSPSSSMFPVSSEDEGERQEEDPTWEVDSPSTHNPERRRSCLKMQGEMRDKLRRRSSMKQVQWDEEGMTWDIHGAAVDPELLNTAIQKHLELKNTPQPAKRPSKKKKRAPKPPLISNVVKAMTPELNPPGMIISSACMVEPESEDLPETERGSAPVQKGAEKKEEAAEVSRKTSRAEAADAEEDEEVYGEEGSSQGKSPTHGSGPTRKRSVIRSLRPGWCGGSRKTDN